MPPPFKTKFEEDFDYERSKDKNEMDGCNEDVALKNTAKWAARWALLQAANEAEMFPYRNGVYDNSKYTKRALCEKLSERLKVMAAEIEN